MKKIILIIAICIFYSCNNNTEYVNSLFSENGNIKSKMNINFNAEFKFGELTKTDTTFYSFQEVDSIGNLIFSVNKYLLLIFLKKISSASKYPGNDKTKFCI